MSGIGTFGVDRKFNTVVIDPPWPQTKTGYRDTRPNQTHNLSYSTMSISEIMAIPIDELVGSGSHVYLWTPNKFLRVAFDVMENWGIVFHVVLVWNKNTGVCPFSWQFRNEFVLFGYKDGLVMNRVGLPTNFSGKVREHSRKPDEFYNLAEQASFPDRIDVFSRESRDGWYQWGDQSEMYD